MGTCPDDAVFSGSGALRKYYEACVIGDSLVLAAKYLLMNSRQLEACFQTSISFKNDDVLIAGDD